MVVAAYSQIGVLVVRSANPAFDDRCRGQGVEAAPHQRFRHPLADDTVIETVDSPAGEATGDPTGEPSTVCSGTCRRSISRRHTP